MATGTSAEIRRRVTWKPREVAKSRNDSRRRWRFTNEAGVLFVVAVVGALAGVATKALVLVYVAPLLLAFAVWRGRERGVHCSFCQRFQDDVRSLVVGPSAVTGRSAAAICDTCAALALGVAMEAAPEGWRLVTGALPRHCPWKVSSVFLDATEDGQDALRAAASTAFRLGNMPALERVLGRIPASERTAGDWINLGIALGKQRRLEEAIEATLRADDPSRRPFVLNNVAWFSAKHSTGAAYRSSTVLLAADAESLLRDVSEAERLLGEKRPRGYERVLSQCSGTRAEILRLKGDLDGALAALALARTRGPTSGEQHLIWALVLDAKGDREGAVEHAREAMEDLHPESLEAREARELLAK
jgi:tetratricopeptide (TPR) repeat protein